MAGQPRQALQITDRAHERGADLGMMLQDLLELTHTVTRLKSVPALRDSQELPEAERTRGAALADRLSVPVLARAWQMLLKGVGEVETAPDRRAAAEMVLIRLCHVVRPAAAGRSGAAAEQRRRAGVAARPHRRRRPVAAARGGRRRRHRSPRPRRPPRRAWRASAMSPPWWPRSARRCCTRTWSTRCTWSASPRR